MDFYGVIKNIKIEGKEVLRILDIYSDDKKITCHTFLENDSKFTDYKTELNSKFILSEDSNEIAIINQECLNIIEIGDNHEFIIHQKYNN